MENWPASGVVGRITHIIYVASSSVSLMLPHCEPSDKPFYLSKPQFYSLYNGGDININDSLRIHQNKVCVKISIQL